ncbi:RNA polymerase sigma factor [Dyadobacter fanqingshengii]|uniref:RNA polymerase sigma factor n=1 Tax=Dyadobacter fanqingshengii TaxID=2906443 RepID=A0A9X1PBZ9_9BACT|nr:RNA polymerase sigma factor [Dyadobacter fanqingshengii]MCF0041128.1 RNA polymerase sigma factor [Dyadobacter fanqingshengii]USJ37145.1 RNA polymerase sigma factor [Dyadobacter fanqingshengii]
MTTLSILAEAQKNDPVAQRKIFDTYGKQLYRLAKRYLSDHDLAQDAVAESFYIVLQKVAAASFIAVPPFEMWMKRILVNECLKIIRRDRRFEFLPDQEEVSIAVVDNDLIESLTAETIFQVIEQLPVGYRTVFNLYEIEGYTHPEIAKLLGISTGTSKSQLSKAKSMLQKRIIELDPIYAQRKII